LEKTTYDRDIVVCDITPAKMADKIAKKNGGTIVLLDSENEILRIVLPDKKIF
jgi:hypothetical protein